MALFIDTVTNYNFTNTGDSSSKYPFGDYGLVINSQKQIYSKFSQYDVARWDSNTKTFIYSQSNFPNNYNGDTNIFLQAQISFGNNENLIIPGGFYNNFFFRVVHKTNLQSIFSYGISDYELVSSKTMQSSLRTPNKFLYNSSSDKFYSVVYNQDVYSDDVQNGKILILENNNNITMAPSNFHEIEFTKKNDSLNSKPEYERRKTSLGLGFLSSSVTSSFKNYTWDAKSDGTIYYCSYQTYQSSSVSPNSILAISRINPDFSHDEEFLIIKDDNDVFFSGPSSMFYDETSNYLYISLQESTGGLGYKIKIYDMNDNSYIGDFNLSEFAFNLTSLKIFHDKQDRKIFIVNDRYVNNGNSYYQLIVIDLNNVSITYLPFQVTSASEDIYGNNYTNIVYNNQTKCLYLARTNYVGTEPSGSDRNSLVEIQLVESGNIYYADIDENIGTSITQSSNKSSIKFLEESLSVNNQLSFNKTLNIDETEEISSNDSINVDKILSSFLIEEIQVNTNVDISKRIITFLQEYISINSEFQYLSNNLITVMLNELIFVKDSVKSNTDMSVVLNEFINLISQGGYINDNEILVFLNEVIKVADAELLVSVNKIISVYLNELFIVSSNMKVNRELHQKLLEQIGVIFQNNSYKDSIVFINENVNIDSNFIVNATYNVLLQELIKASIVIKLGDEIFEAYCINLENNALTKYDNFDFNSYCQYKQEYYGMKKDGLYILKGDMDNDNYVKGKVKTGYFNIANSQTKDNNFSSIRDKMKRLSSAYLIVKNNREMIFRIYNDQSQAFDYKLKELYDNEKWRQEIGKKLESHMFQFEFIGEGTLEIKECEVIPIVLNRRI